MSSNIPREEAVMAVGIVGLLCIFALLSVAGLLVRRDGHIHLHG